MQIIAGTTRGSANSKGSNKNQDSYFLGWNQDVIAGFVSDGCGSAPNSEVGSAMFAAAAVRWALTNKATILNPLSLTYHLHDEVVHRIHAIFDSADPGYATILGFIITPEFYYVLGCGDGSFETNGEWHHLEYPNNAPPYIAAGEKIKVLASGHRYDLRSLTVATDGVDYWREGLDLPGGKVSVPLADFLADKENFKNPSSLQRYLNLLNRDLREDGMLLHGPTLADDTTIISLRRPDESPGPERHELFPGIVLGKRWGG